MDMMLHSCLGMSVAILPSPFLVSAIDCMVNATVWLIMYKGSPRVFHTRSIRGESFCIHPSTCGVYMICSTGITSSVYTKPVNNKLGSSTPTVYISKSVVIKIHPYRISRGSHGIQLRWQTDGSLVWIRPYIRDQQHGVAVDKSREIGTYVTVPIAEIPPTTPVVAVDKSREAGTYWSQMESVE
jgi:hypothetical protein